MNVLISIFAASLLGTMAMVLYKILSLRSKANIVLPSREPLSHHVGSLANRIGQFIGGVIGRWFNQRFVPFIGMVATTVVVVIIRLFKNIRAFIVHVIESRRSKDASSKGAASFYLKDISEHKKNMKNGNGKQDIGAEE